ncbi:hypothetical protein EC973_006521 [Apophysomyces ossiformis]|uniref:Galactose oxidase n=1 Tax=Apophysomyces ossiformis TaxID=679940 RepID=A0A8H7ER25_9FUNG|nr:hypothetical protein EC973_006521 [Apophysomyces ossiformis]
MPESPTLPPEINDLDSLNLISEPRRPSADFPTSISTPTLQRNPYSSNKNAVHTARGPSSNLPPSASFIASNTSNGYATDRARIPTSSSSKNVSLHKHSSSDHVRSVSSSSSSHSHRTKRSPSVSSQLAANAELTGSPNVPPAPAAGMYWSRAITYGRGPSRPLRAHTANLIGEYLYVFGGCDIKTCFNTLYILDMDTLTWSKPRTSGQVPPPCRAHSSTVVEGKNTNGRPTYYLYVFGGGDGPNYFNDLYVLNRDTMVWSKPNTEGTPPSPRRAHTTCLWNNKIIVFGGGDGARALSDVHALDISDPSRPRWQQLHPTGDPPIARGYHTSNLVKNKLVIFGGSDGHECFNDVYVLDLVANHWSHMELDHTISRLAHSATQVGSYVFVVGGHDGGRYSNDTLLFNLVTMSWESRKIYGKGPSPRGYHTAVLYDSRLFILGGYDGRTVFEDIYMLELSACAYLPQITNFEIDV